MIMRNILNILNIISIISLALAIFCATPKAKANDAVFYPYATVQFEYRFNEADAMFYTDATNSYSVQTRDLANDRFLMQLGFETKAGWAFGYQHISSATMGCPLDCGGAEYHRDSVFIRYKFGGVK